MQQAEEAAARVSTAFDALTTWCPIGLSPASTSPAALPDPSPLLIARPFALRLTGQGHVADGREEGQGQEEKVERRRSSLKFPGGLLEQALFRGASYNHPNLGDVYWPWGNPPPTIARLSSTRNVQGCATGCAGAGAHLPLPLPHYHRHLARHPSPVKFLLQ